MAKGFKRGNNYIIDEENEIAKIELHRKTEENIWTIIDLEDLDRVINFPYTWSPSWNDNSKTFYCHTIDYSCSKSKKIALQVFIANPEEDKSVFIDHINHNTLDNRKENLRKTTNIYNTKHRKGKNSNNTSGYRNVAYIKRDKHPYWVQIMIDGKNTVMGKFDDVDEAGEFAKTMRDKYYGEFQGRG